MGQFGRTLRECHSEFPECCALSTLAETRLAVIPAQAGIQLTVPGFRVAACGLARNDGRVEFVIPAEAGIQGV